MLRFSTDVICHQESSGKDILAPLNDFQDDRIMETFELEGTPKGHLVQLPCNEHGHLQVDQVPQSPILPDLECFQGHGIHRLSGQPDK